MDDLFKIFPDLPWLPDKAVADRVREARERDARVKRVRITAENNAARIRAAMQRRKRRAY
jgi:hypothetical protein